MTRTVYALDEFPMSEDCLTLNVFTPGVGAWRRPVLVWIHGGGFISGTSAAPIYDGVALARRGDVVVVTLNYRIGALGFLPLPALAREEGGSAGNLGLLDQLLALEWVRDEIGAFGGDPGNVTVFGESAGAMSIGTLLGLPAARGLFHRAILQSGASHNVSDPEQGRRVAETFVPELGVGSEDLAQLREAPPRAFVDAQNRCLARLWQEVRGLAFQPVVDDRLIRQAPLEAIAAGEASEVPVLIGTNLDEYKFFGVGDRTLSKLDEAGLERRLARRLPRDGDGNSLARAAIEAYRTLREGRAPVDPAELWFAIETDRLFRLPALRLVEARDHHAAPSFVYLFTRTSPALGGALGSCHALEVPFVFGTHTVPAVKAFVGEGDEVEQLSRTMQECWIAFARCGEPVHPELETWPRYDLERRPTRRLDAPCDVESDPLAGERRFWDGIL
jgi:para-nitrobenzyl esterase